MRAQGMTALLTTAGLVSGLLVGAPAAVAARTATTVTGGSPGTIRTVAGGLGAGPATNVFQVPAALAAAPNGDLYVSDSNYGGIVREVNGTDSWERVFAGNGSPVGGYSGDGGPATDAGLFLPGGLGVDRSGNVLIADTYDHRIRVVAHRTGTIYGQNMKAGYIYTVAGDGTRGFSGDGGAATSAELAYPQSAVADAAGNLVIADTENFRVRVVADKTGTFYGQAMKAGNIYTVAGDGTEGDTGDGGPATAADVEADSATVDPAGNLVITDEIGSVIRVVAASTGTFYGVAMTAGNIYTVAGNGTFGFSGDGGPATKAQLNSPGDAAVDPAGNLIIADTGNRRIRVVAGATGTFYGQAMTAGDIYTVAGDGIGGGYHSGGLATSTYLYSPVAVAVDAAGNLVIGDNLRHDRVWVAPATTGTFYQQAMTAGHIYIVAGSGSLGSSGGGGKAIDAEGCCTSPRGDSVAVDGSNYLVLGEQKAWFIANKTGTYFGQQMAAGDIYVVAGTGYMGYNGNGRTATSAKLNDPESLTVDKAGNLIIADTRNDRVRVVAAQTGVFYGHAMTIGHVYTVAGNGRFGFSGDGGPATAAKLLFPRGLVVDGAGNLLISDSGNNRIRVVAASTGTFYDVAMTAGDIYTVAGTGRSGFSGDGGPATEARLQTPAGLAVDSAGNVIVAVPNSQRIRVVAAATGTFYDVAMTAGDIYTVAGNGIRGWFADGIPARASSLFEPSAVALDGAGNLVILDGGNDRIRVVAARTGRFYEQAMTAGHIYTVAGNGTYGFSGDGGPATAAELTAAGLAIDGAGNLLISDSGSDRLRVVTG